MGEISYGRSKSCPFRLRFFTIPILIVCLLLSISSLGCQEMFKEMGEMMALQQELAKEFNTQNIGIKISNNTHLALTFQNSPMANLP